MWINLEMALFYMNHVVIKLYKLVINLDHSQKNIKLILKHCIILSIYILSHMLMMIKLKFLIPKLKKIQKIKIKRIFFFLIFF